MYHVVWMLAVSIVNRIHKMRVLCYISRLSGSLTGWVAFSTSCPRVRRQHCETCGGWLRPVWDLASCIRRASELSVSWDNWYQRVNTTNWKRPDSFPTSLSLLFLFCTLFSCTVFRTVGVVVRMASGLEKKSRTINPQRLFSADLALSWNGLQKFRQVK